MQIVQQIEVLRNAVTALRREGGTLALVPTMGALHEGHLALVREARRRADHVAVSIFVNPRQFGVGEDLDAYPRQLDADTRLLEREGVALLWAPEVAQMYPAEFSTNVTVDGASENLCGAARPGHFDGVATVVLKLFNQVRPDLAVFGEKDWQQLAVIRRMARDLDLSYPSADAIIGLPTVREADGLALSSRNAYLSTVERGIASALPQILRSAARRIRQGEDWSRIHADCLADLMAAGFGTVDYLELRDGDSLRPLTRAAPAARIFVAAKVGGTRLIDNMPAV